MRTAAAACCSASPAWRPGEFQSCLVTHERSGSSVRAVTINRMATSGARVTEEIETAILRQLASDPVTGHAPAPAPAPHRAARV